MQKEKPVYRYPKNWDGLEALKKSAYEDNDSFSQLYLGIIYLDGWIDGVQINRQEGKSLISKSAANGNIVAPEAYYMYFRNDTDYKRHLIVTSLKDLIDVFSTVKADYYNGNNLYTVLLGFMYHYGTGVEKNYEEAHRLYTLSAAELNATGECMSAYVYLFAVGVEQDMAMSVHYMQRAADQGNCSAQSNLGYLYEHGFGVQEDKQRAYEYYVSAAEQANSTAQCNLGYYYSTGTVVEKNTVTSFEYFKQSAADNDCDAQLAVGDFYLQGTPPCERDYVEAMKWFRLSADQGNSNAFQKMACMYKDGQGVTPDMAQAMRYLKMAADQDNLTALLQLSEIYQTGLPGVPANLKESIRLLQLAQAKGDRTAQNKLESNSSLQAFLRKEEKQSKEFHQSFERNAQGVGMRKSAYEFHEKLGSGGFGVVYRATKVQSSLFSSKTVSYAIKLLNQFTDGLKMEIGVHKSLSHVNVVALHDSFISKIDNMEILHIVMDLCESDLQKFLDTEHPIVLSLYGSSNLTARVNLFKDWSYQMLSGLEYIHLNNLMHRDIKPGNILLKYADNKIIPKYSDFGESKFLQQQNNTNTYVGTPLYEAPELWRVTFGKIPDAYTNLIDVWSLGLVLLQVLFVMPFKELGQFLTDAKLTVGSAESRKSFVKDFCKDMVQPLIERDFRQYDATWVKVLSELFGQMLCINRDPAGVVLQSEYMKSWRKEVEKRVAMTGMNRVKRD